jgi:hypothetical protein
VSGSNSASTHDQRRPQRARTPTNPEACHVVEERHFARGTVRRHFGVVPSRDLESSHEPAARRIVVRSSRGYGSLALRIRTILVRRGRSNSSATAHGHSRAGDARTLVQEGFIGHAPRQCLTCARAVDPSSTTPSNPDDPSRELKRPDQPLRAITARAHSSPIASRACRREQRNRRVGRFRRVKREFFSPRRRCGPRRTIDGQGLMTARRRCRLPCRSSTAA